jgi:mRNA-degrading endonuclease toxin of MazEF toxin-antitoxin module
LEEEAMSHPLRGYLYWVTLDKRRPGLVISPDYRNELAHDVMIVPCSTVLRLAPTHVRLKRGDGGIGQASVLKCEQLTTLHKDDVGRTPLGNSLSDVCLARVERAILRAIGVAL